MKKMISSEKLEEISKYLSENSESLLAGVSELNSETNEYITKMSVVSLAQTKEPYTL